MEGCNIFVWSNENYNLNKDGSGDTKRLFWGDYTDLKKISRVSGFGTLYDNWGDQISSYKCQC